MLRELKKKLCIQSFRAQMGIFLILFTMIPSILIFSVSQYIYEKHILDQASSIIYSIVSTNNKSIERILKQIEDTSLLMLNDEEYYRIFSNLEHVSVSDYMKYDRKISTELTKQFSTQKQVYESYIYTSNWIFGEKDVMSTTLAGIEASGLPEKAREAKGEPCWVSGYDYGKMTDSVFLQEKDNYIYRYPITMVRQMNFQYNFLGEYERVSEEDGNPTLMVYITEDSIREVYQNSIEYTGSIYGILNEDGVILSSDSKNFPVGEKISRHMKLENGAIEENGGMTRIQFHKKEYLLCYETMDSTKWCSFCLVPMDTLVENTTAQVKQLQIRLLAIFIFLSMLAALLLSKTLTKPIKRLIDASQRAAKGDFRADTPLPKETELRQLTESFNHMETEISRLIHENYEIKLKEESTKLKMLSMQINPHFLYNTLNTINMLAIRNGDEETSDLIVSLSQMLQYTLKNKEQKVKLSEEIKWLSDYLAIMSKRYQGVFVTHISIEEELQQCLVPKFFLQPIAENAIIHGFDGMTQGGILTIDAKQDESRLYIRIVDNGKGMEEELIQRFVIDAMSEENIGMSNVHKRLSLLYGEQYQVKVESAVGEGMILHLYLPLER